jgi:pimeloyl-ACP methyl ester carboxylesterase
MRLRCRHARGNRIRRCGVCWVRSAGPSSGTIRSLTVTCYCCALSLANVIALALVGAAAGQGWIGALLAADEGGLVRAIVAVFLVGLVWSGQRAAQLSHALNELERFAKVPGAPAPAYLEAIAGRAAESRTLLASSLRLKLAARMRERLRSLA